MLVLARDSDSFLMALARLKIHRCALIGADGSAVVAEANINDIRQDIPLLYHNDDSTSKR
jgi:hypothetical protein